MALSLKGCPSKEKKRLRGYSLNPMSVWEVDTEDEMVLSINLGRDTTGQTIAEIA